MSSSANANDTRWRAPCFVTLTTLAFPVTPPVPGTFISNDAKPASVPSFAFACSSRSFAMRGGAAMLHAYHSYLQPHICPHAAPPPHSERHWRSHVDPDDDGEGGGVASVVQRPSATCVQTFVS